MQAPINLASICMGSIWGKLCAWMFQSNAAHDAELQHTKAEVAALRSQNAVLSKGHAAEQMWLQGDVCGAIIRALKAESTVM